MVGAAGCWAVGLGDAPSNREKPSALFFGAAFSASKTTPLPIAAALFALYGEGQG